ncbi:MAG: DUF2993 domain-containing protein [Synergistaceae bacterium]|jgi:hypothetical protein|nr:DUF2993 domain-containing protein [Synergistaceae bacterium]
MCETFRNWKIRSRPALAGLLILCSVALAPPSEAAIDDAGMALHIAGLLGTRFSPESLFVTVKESRAYAEMKGAVLDKIRVDTMKLDVLLTREGAQLSDDVNSLASLIGYSKGEIVLLEDDVNAYFGNNDTRGFSNLTFDFKPEAFRADGIFTASFLFTLRIRLSATGILSLGSDGVYLDDVRIYVEKIRQPEALTNQVLSRVNPLIAWGDIPFKVEFKTVTMDDKSAVMTGYPVTVEGGATAVWEGGECSLVP